LRAKLPEVRIIVCGGDDYRTAGNPSKKSAIEAAITVGGDVAIPDFGHDRPEGATDFNDLARCCGIEAVERAIANAKAPDARFSQTVSENAAAADPGLRVLTLGELMRHHFPELEAILAPWLLSQSLSTIHAWRGIGKTHISVGKFDASYLRIVTPDAQEGPMPDLATVEGRTRALSVHVA